MTPGARDVLLVIDVQVDFLPGGALAVPEGDAVVGPVNRLLGLFPHAVLTQDWHPPGHVSFASEPSRPGALRHRGAGLWPADAVAGALRAGQRRGRPRPRPRGGPRRAGDPQGPPPRVDSYSAFLEADRRTPTGLAGYLRERGFTRVVLCGLATDYCVAWSALDARAAGFEALVVEDAVRGIDRDGSVARAWADMAAAGVGRITSGAIGGG